MPNRAFALIFFFWALLAIITPTLVNWSVQANGSAISFPVEKYEISWRRKIGEWRKTYRPDKSKAVEDQGPSPAPEPGRIVRAIEEQTDQIENLQAKF